MRVRAALGALALPILLPCATFASTPPLGFIENVLVDSSEAPSPTAIAYEPGSGNLYVLEKGVGTSSGTARVRIWNRASDTVTTVLTLSCVDSLGERGLLGIAFDPDYLAGSRFVYLYYTHAFSGGSCGAVSASKTALAGHESSLASTGAASASHCSDSDRGKNAIGVVRSGALPLPKRRPHAISPPSASWSSHSGR